jgi:hypothetical protein
VPVRDRRQAVEIVFDHATKHYPGRPVPAVDDLSISIPAGEVCVLVGPSGGGKTTAMKLVNRLVELTSGDITVGGRSVKSLDRTELRRGMGYVIQQVGLFPHLTVADNVATVPRLLGWGKKETAARVDELLPPLLLFAVGLSLIVAPLTSTVLADAGEHDAGIASGVNNAVARVAGLLGIAVVGASIAGADNRLDLPGFRRSMLITAGLVAAGGVIGLLGIRNTGVERG